MTIQVTQITIEKKTSETASKKKQNTTKKYIVTYRTLDAVNRIRQYEKPVSVLNPNDTIERVYSYPNSVSKSSFSNRDRSVDLFETIRKIGDHLEGTTNGETVTVYMDVASNVKPCALRNKEQVYRAFKDAFEYTKKKVKDLIWHFGCSDRIFLESLMYCFRPESKDLVSLEELNTHFKEDNVTFMDCNTRGKYGGFEAFLTDIIGPPKFETITESVHANLFCDNGKIISATSKWGHCIFDVTKGIVRVETDSNKTMFITVVVECKEDPKFHLVLPGHKISFEQSRLHEKIRRLANLYESAKLAITDEETKKRKRETRILFNDCVDTPPKRGSADMLVMKTIVQDSDWSGVGLNRQGLDVERFPSVTHNMLAPTSSGMVQRYRSGI